MFYLHPVFQVIATLLGLYALWQGWQRVKTRHLGMRADFPWTGHARLGKRVVLLWMIGISVAVIIIGLKQMLFRPGPHVYIGWAFIPLAIFVFIAGRTLETSGGRKKNLAVAHGTGGLLLVLAALYQCVTGALMMYW